MKRTLLAFAVACILIGCKREPVMLSFDYQLIAPLMVEFYNNSIGFEEYKWDFGDGMWSYDIDAVHAYESTGTYTVTLTGTIDGRKYDYSQSVTISDPVPYIAGYTLYHIPYENRYYKVVFKDDNLLPSSWDFSTSYTPLLDETDLPYTVSFRTPVSMEDYAAHTYYTVQVIRSTNTGNTDSDISCMKQTLKVADLKQFKHEYILQTETGSTAIGVKMVYDY